MHTHSYAHAARALRAACSAGGYAYFETDTAPGCIVEAIELPKALPDPERAYPD